MQSTGVRVGLALIVIAAITDHALAITITINPAVERQTMEGFGCANPRGKAATLVNDLGLTTHRDEIAGDQSAWAGWSQLKELRSLGVKTFFATPWSPPDYMKVNGTLAGMDEKTNKLKPDQYEAFADLLVQYCKNFQTNVGSDCQLWLSPQNEPRFPEGYQSCVYTVAEYQRLVKVLGPKLRAQVPKVKLALAEDMLYDWASWLRVVCSDTGVLKYVDGLSVHAYMDGIKPSGSRVADKKWPALYAYARGGNPLKKTMVTLETETSGYTDTWLNGPMTTWQGERVAEAPGGLGLGCDIATALKLGGVSQWFYWGCFGSQYYTVLDNGVRQASQMFYKYIRPGYVNVQSTQDTPDSLLFEVAFRDKVGKKLVTVLCYAGTTERTVTLAGAGVPAQFQAFRSSISESCADIGVVMNGNLKVAAQSITTLIGTGYDPPVASVDPTVTRVRRMLADGYTFKECSLAGRLLRATAIHGAAGLRCKTFLDRSGMAVMSRMVVQ